MSNLKVDQVRIFICAVECGSFSAAAKKLFMSQSAVSQKIMHLEEELGFQLFDRSQYRPQLTKKGKIYYENVKYIVEEYDHLLNYLNNHKEKSIVIGFQGPFMRKCIPHFLEQYLSSHQEQVELKYVPLGQCANLFQKHNLDIAIGNYNNLEILPYIICKKIYSARVYVCVSKKHRLASRQKISVQEIKNEPIVTLSRAAGEGLYNDFMRNCEKDDFIPNIVKECDSFEDLLMSVRLNQGVAFVSKEFVNDDSQYSFLECDDTHHTAYFGVAYYDHAYDELVDEMIAFFQNIGQNKGS